MKHPLPELKVAYGQGGPHVLISYLMNHSITRAILAKTWEQATHTFKHVLDSNPYITYIKCSSFDIVNPSPEYYKQYSMAVLEHQSQMFWDDFLRDMRDYINKSDLVPKHLKKCNWQFDPSFEDQLIEIMNDELYYHNVCRNCNGTCVLPLEGTHFEFFLKKRDDYLDTKPWFDLDSNLTQKCVAPLQDIDKPLYLFNRTFMFSPSGLSDAALSPKEINSYFYFQNPKFIQQPKEINRLFTNYRFNLKKPKHLSKITDAYYRKQYPEIFKLFDQ